MEFNRITILIWTAGFVFVAGAFLQSRVILASAFTLGAVAIAELLIGAYLASKIQQEYYDPERAESANGRMDQETDAKNRQ
jgi:hypothetical protein